jgi:chitin synthase
LRAPPFGNDPYFNADFTLDGKRRASQSLHNQHLLTSKDTRHPGQLAGRRKSSCVLVNRRASKYGIEEEKEVRAIGKKRLYWTKIGVIITFIIFNVGFSAISWVFPKYWWVFAPVILLGNALNTLMVLNLTRCWIQGLIVKGYRRVSNKPVTPPSIHIPTTIAMVLACYCESYTDLMRTLDSLSEQEKIEHHKKMFIVICDGQVKGKGMEKSTDRILVEDIFKPDEEMYFPVGYESWDGAINGVYASCGVYNDIPYCCIVKKRNLGKRDGLILIRTLLYKYQERYGNPITSMGSDFFTWFCEFSESHGIDKFEWLVGVDADTTFNNECIYELHKDCVADPKLIGSSGLIQVGWQTGNWNLWNLYQNTEYMRAQCLRRMHQALGTGKVSCLPGACQIIKICEESCGDKILIDLFGQLPDPKDNLVHQIRALAGEDRNYICLIFFNSPKVQTTMSLKAIAYTDPPNGFWVFLSQRKRWTLSTCANDILIASKNQMNWFERLCSVADILSWGLPFFILQTFALFVKACIHAEDFVFLLAFAMLTIIPITYGFVVTIWACHGWRFKLQYLIGMFMLITMAQGVTPIVIAYAIWHMDNFAWGKTREIEEDPENKPAHSE